jgi:hypothetical protein
MLASHWTNGERFPPRNRRTATFNPRDVSNTASQLLTDRWLFELIIRIQPATVASEDSSHIAKAKRIDCQKNWQVYEIIITQSFALMKS